MKRPGDYLAVRVWGSEGGRDLRCRILAGVVVQVDPPTGAGDDRGQWVIALTIEGLFIRFV